MEQFLLKYSWFTLNYIFKNLGLDLLKRDGKGGLKPTSACRFWSCLVCTYVVINFGIIAIYCFILMVEKTPEDLMTSYKDIFMNSVTNMFAFFSNFVMFSGLAFMGVFKLRTLSRGLVGVQDYFKQNALINEQVIKKCMKTFFSIIFPYMGIMIIGICLAWTSANTLIFSTLNVSIFWTILLSIFTSILFMIYCAPIWCFLFIYMEVSFNLRII